MALLGIHTKIWVDEFDFSGFSNGLDINFANRTIDVTPFQATGAESLVGWGEAAIAQRGYFQGTAADGFEAEMYARLGVRDVYVAGVLGTNTALCPAYVARSSGLSEMAIAAPTQEVITLSGVWARGRGMLRGLRVHDGAISATGATATRDFGAAGTAGGKAWLFVRSITGSATDATVVVQSATAADFSDAADEGTFTFSAVGSYEVALSGAIGRYIRLNVTDLGGATAFTAGAIVAVAGVTY